jgi:hypothetical protein
VLALEALRAGAIEARVLKGVANAHLDYASPSDRIFGDADVLVRRSDLERSLRLLTAAGFRRGEPPVRRWWERRFGKAVVLHSPTCGELDLHLAITGGYFGARLDHDLLWSAPPAPFELAGATALGLDQRGRLLHACCHAVLGGGSGLRAKRDVAQLILLGEADWRSVVDDATGHGSGIVTAAAIAASWADLRLDPEHPAAMWAAGYQPGEDELTALSTYRAAAAEGWAREGKGVLAALSVPDRAMFLLGLAVPSRQSLRFRQRTWLQHLRLGASPSRRRP